MFEHLLAPISDDSPSGIYLKDDRSRYRGYRNAFNEAQSSFRQLVETPDALDDLEAVSKNATNWETLASECSDCLLSVSKDVEILSWFTVSQLFLNDPLNRLASALELFEQMLEQHWDTLNPMLPEGKRKGASESEQAQEVVDHRIKPLLQLVGDTPESGLLYMPLQMQSLVADIDYGTFFRAEKAGALGDLKSTASSAFAGEKSEITERIQALGVAAHALEKIELSLTEKCAATGAQTVSFRYVKDVVQRLINALRYLVGDQYAQWPLDPEAEVAAQVETVQTVTPVADESATPEQGQATASAAMSEATSAALSMPAFNSQSTIANREQALAQLQTIAEYFLATEPHSPIYMLLKRAVRWGGLSLPELLQELVGENASVHQRIEQLAGLESVSYSAQFKQAAAMQVVNSAAEPVSVAPVVTPTESSTTVSVSMPEETSDAAVQQSEESSSEGGLSNFEW